MAELADAPDLGSGVARRAGSSPVSRTLLLHKDFGQIARSPFSLAENESDTNPTQPTVNAGFVSINFLGLPA